MKIEKVLRQTEHYKGENLKTGEVYVVLSDDPHGTIPVGTIAIRVGETIVYPELNFYSSLFFKTDMKFRKLYKEESVTFKGV